MTAFKTRTLVAAAAAMTMALTMSACGSSSSSSSDSDSAAASSGSGSGGDYTIGVSVADQKSLFYIAAVDGMKKAAEDAGVKLVVLSADNNVPQQVNQVNDLITQQVDALIFIAQDATAAAAGVKAANNADIPVIAVDQKPESGDGELATYIATDSVKAADELCTWVFDKMGGSGEIGILQGVLGSTAELQRSEGCQKAIDATPASTWSPRSPPTGTRPRATRRPRTCCRPTRTSRPSSARATRWAWAPPRPRRTRAWTSSPSASTASPP